MCRTPKSNMTMLNHQNSQHASKSKEPLSEAFPVGMRVLAVDDDRTCLRMLEQMLLKCRYNVTATTQSRKAIEMLRENKDNFDVVITDVNMPDIDGFKLLELVGLEMDLPVIMVTEHKEPNLVKKGVVHGACDYLLKPVRMEELQIIWRHVFRKKVDSKDQKACNVTEQGIQGVASESCANHDKRLDKKRKEQSEEEDEDADDNEQENENASTHKKPRLVWGEELCSKFEAAVNQLGLDKAVPKKILKLMNVEGLTRENVASHLQKYRLNQKRAAQQGRTVAALGGCDHYLHTSLLDRYASGSERLPTAGLPSYASGGIFPRLHSPCALNLRGMTSSSPLVRVDNSQNMTGSIRGLCNIQPTIFPAYQSSNFMQGIPAPNELYHFQQNNYATGIRQLNPADVSSDYSLSGFTSHNPLLQGNYPATHNLNARRNHSPLGAAYVRAGSFDTGISGSSNLLEYNPCSEATQMETKLSRVLANSLQSGQSFNNNQLPQSNLKFSSSTSHAGNIVVDLSSRSEGLIGNIIEASCSIPQQGLEQHKEDLDARISSSIGETSSLGHASNQNNNIGIKRVDASFASQQNEVTPSVDQNTELEDTCVLQQSDFDSLDDILIDMVTPEQNGIFFMNDEMVFDADQTIGSCF